MAYGGRMNDDQYTVRQTSRQGIPGDDFSFRPYPLFDIMGIVRKRGDQMKKTVALLLAASILLPLYAAAESGPDKTLPASDARTPSTVIGFARELSLLVAGIGWEAVRIVLPESCPAKHKDIDKLLDNTTVQK
jgi:hypothetical protein